MTRAHVTGVLECSDDKKKSEPDSIIAKLKSCHEAERQQAKELLGEE